MLLRDTFTIALRGITTNKSRSLLTMLGIIIGVGSVVLMTSIGGSVQELIVGQVSSLGANSMVIFPGQEDGNGAGAGYDSLTMEDMHALEQLPSVTTIAPIIIVNGKVTYGREETNSQIMGTSDNYFKNQSISVDRGRLIDSTDQSSGNFVAVLAPDAAKDLFGDQDPMGKRVKIREKSFTVIGITKPLGSQFFQNADKRVYVPLSTARLLTGQKYVNFVTMTATVDTALAEEDVQALLRRRHQINNPADDPTKDDFQVRSAQQALDILGTVSVSLTLFLSAIAAISLVVGGIGIMNIMLVAVTERTREIGLRKAVGARKRDILMQFLIEAVLLTVIGGLIGIVSGLGIAAFIALVAKRFLAAYVFVISPGSIVLAVSVAATVGLVFGIYPARRAANLSPMEALRYE